MIFGDLFCLNCRNLHEIDNCISEQMDTVIGYKIPSRDCNDMIEFVRQLKAATQFDPAVQLCHDESLSRTTTGPVGPTDQTGSIL